jgi:acyl CoA:acetate/3-ketoacid CoA transferase beta subunit
VTATAASPDEQDAVFISHLLRDRDRVLIGAGLVAPRAAALLAALGHTPGLAVNQSLGWLDVGALAETRPPRPGMDLRDAAGAEALIADDEAYDDVRRLSTLFVIGGLQIDRSGASNLLGIREGGRWIRRGPGAIGTTSMAVIAERTVLYTRRHTPDIFVERCSVVSAPGHDPDDPDAPAGPILCISPAGIFDFPAPAKRMRLLHRREGWPPARVAEATGFEVAGLDTATPMPQPSLAELELLRGRVDRDGALR